MECHPEYSKSGECFLSQVNPEDSGNPRKMSFVNLLDLPGFPEVPSLELIPSHLDLPVPDLCTSSRVACRLNLDLLVPQTRPIPRPLKKTARRHIAKPSCCFIRKRIARSRHRHKGRFISTAAAEDLFAQQTPP